MLKLKNIFQFLRRSALWIIFITTILLYIFAFLAAYLPPNNWWFLSLISFGFPLLMIVLVFLIPIMWWRHKKKAAVFGLVILIASYPLASKVVGTSFFSKQTKGSFSLLSWNVARFGYGQGFNVKFAPNREEIINTIGQIQPDIMCLQEYWYIDSLHHKWNHLEYMKDSMNYPYHMFTNDFNWSGSGALFGGNIIFSRYPIVKVSQAKLFSIGKTEDIGIADIAINGDTIRFITYHLRSNKLNADEIKTIGNSETAKLESKNIAVGKTILKKLRSGTLDRATQAKILHKEVAESPYPVISTGDFNDIPNSYSYRIASQGLKDAFLEKSYGWGRTYTGISPTLRIDYTMYSPSLVCNSFERIRYPQSDHFALLSSFSLKK